MHAIVGYIYHRQKLTISIDTDNNALEHRTHTPSIGTLHIKRGLRQQPVVYNAMIWIMHGLCLNITDIFYSISNKTNICLRCI